jgi:hypothetical protein
MWRRLLPGLCLALAETTPSVSAVAMNKSIPHLTGIFVSLDDTTANRSVDGWVADLTAMKAIGIEWFCLRAVLGGTETPEVSPQCPFGGFIAYVL